MSSDLVLVESPKTGSIVTTAQAGAMANHYAAMNTIEDHRMKKADATLIAYDNDLVTFADYLKIVGVKVEGADLATDPTAWAGITWGLVKGFVQWMLQAGFAVDSINRKLSTVKVYAKLAAQAGVLSTDDLALIRTVAVSYTHLTLPTSDLV